jgi:hypothetical protein
MILPPAPASRTAGGRLSPPLIHFTTAVLFLLIFAGALFWGRGKLLGFSFEARWALGLAHLLTLGVITMTMMGALGQLLPVVWLVPANDVQRWMRPAWALFTVSLLLFVGTLWSGSSWYGIPALGLFSALGLYGVGFARAVFKVKTWDFVAVHVATSLGYLAVLALLGTLLAWDQQRGLLFPHPEGALIAHIHLALVGWVSLLICGVSYRLIPMFALSHDERKMPGRLAFALINIGLWGLALESLWGNRKGFPLWALLLAGGFVAYATQMKMIFSQRHRRIDPSLALTLVALGGGALWAGLGLGLAFGRWAGATGPRAAYILAALLGWALPFVVGQLTKILPFLVWLSAFHPSLRSPEEGPAPTTQNLTRPSLTWAQVMLWPFALGGVVAGFFWENQTFLNIGAGLFVAIAVLFAINAGGTLSYAFGRPWKGAQ